MTKESKKDLYVSPDLRIIDVELTKVVCGSRSGDTDKMDWGEDDDDDNWQ